MRICVVAPSTKYRTKSAGARIRYLRIEPGLAALGHTLEIVSIDEFRKPVVLSADVYLFSKCYDVRGIALARVLKQEGAVVGVDFFDDHFSQSDDARLVHRREWMTEMTGLTDFALHSTARMAGVIGALWPDRPGHVMNDPFGEFDAMALGDDIERKLLQVRSSQQVRIGWFGQGDNNHFPVGLRDLAGFGHVLSQLQGRFDVHLDILTNLRALHTGGLERIHSLPVPLTIREWTQSRETALLNECQVAFIPVNGQPFSIAKSLNRAVSALTNGCQVLSNGYPLYSPFAAYIYSDVVELADALATGQTALRRETAPGLLTLMSEIGDPAVEAARLASFLMDMLTGIQRSPRDTSSHCMAVLHGQASLHNASAVTRRLGFLSIASPFAAEAPVYDVTFHPSNDSASVEFGAEALEWLAPGLAAVARLLDSDADEPRFTVDLAGVVTGAVLRELARPRPHAFVPTVVRYASGMAATRSACERLFPGIEIIVSEADPSLNEWSAGGVAQS